MIKYIPTFIVEMSQNWRRIIWEYYLFDNNRPTFKFNPMTTEVGFLRRPADGTFLRLRRPVSGKSWGCLWMSQVPVYIWTSSSRCTVCTVVWTCSSSGNYLHFVIRKLSTMYIVWQRMASQRLEWDFYSGHFGRFERWYAFTVFIHVQRPL